MKKAIVIFDIILGFIDIFFLFATLIIGISEHDAYYMSMTVFVYLLFIRHLNTLDNDLKDMRREKVS